MNITIEIRTIYGQPRAYPACDKSRGFAALLGTKTLTRANLRQIEALGYRIETVSSVSLGEVA